MTMLTFTVPGAPVPCARARVYADKRTGQVRAVTPSKTRAYEKHVATCAQIAVNLARWKPIEADYVVSIVVYRARRQGDWDNFAKAQADGMNRIVYPDDHMIVEAHVVLADDPVNPRVEVSVTQRPRAA